MKTPVKLAKLAKQAGMDMKMGAGDATEEWTLSRSAYDLVLSASTVRRHWENHGRYLISFRPGFEPHHLFQRVYNGSVTNDAASSLLDILVVLNERAGRRAMVGRGIHGLGLSLADAVRLYGLDVKSYRMVGNTSDAILITASGSSAISLRAIAKEWVVVRERADLLMPPLIPTNPLFSRETKTLMFEIPASR